MHVTRAAVALASVLFLASCAASQRSLDASWSQFQREHAAARLHAERVCASTADHARARGDEKLLAAVTMPPHSPIARLSDASTLASLAYLSGDRDSIDRALAAVRECESDVAALERELPAPK
jgi:hypothetical protein